MRKKRSRHIEDPLQDAVNRVEKALGEHWREHTLEEILTIALSLGVEQEYCVLCGAATTPYDQWLDHERVAALRALCSFDGPVPRDQLAVSGIAYAKMAALAWWGLAVADEDEKTWTATARGRAFIAGEIAVRQKRRIFRGEVVDVSGPMIYVHQIVTPKDQKAAVIASLGPRPAVA